MFSRNDLAQHRQAMQDTAGGAFGYSYEQPRDADGYTRERNHQLAMTRIQKTCRDKGIEFDANNLNTETMYEGDQEIRIYRYNPVF